MSLKHFFVIHTIYWSSHITRVCVQIEIVFQVSVMVHGPLVSYWF